MSLKLTGWNDFYEGWLMQVLGVPLPERVCEDMVDGYRMGEETGPDAIQVLRDEINLNHIHVEIIE